MNPTHDVECCPRFDPAPWDGKTIQWENKRFLKDRVTSIFHIPLNFGSVMTRGMGVICAAGANPENIVVLTDETSPWGADLYIEVTKDIPGARMATISGTFLSKVFEGPYRNMGKWIKEMTSIVTAGDKSIEKLYFFYTTCPKCAKKYGKNYVVILARTSAG